MIKIPISFTLTNTCELFGLTFKMMTIWFILLLVINVRVSSGFKSGAPDNVYYCESLTPGHRTVENSSLPLYVAAEKTGSNEYSVRIWSEETTLRGFLLTALSRNESQTLLGNFTTIPVESKHICNNKGVTHTNNTDHTELNFTYTTDMSFQGDVYFKSVIVTRIYQDWKIASSLPTSSPSDPPTTTPAPSGNVNNDPECGITKGCFSECSGSTCQFLITWQTVGENVKFEMLKDIGVRGDDIYFAIGLSEDAKMGSDHVIMCILSGGQSAVEVGRNAPKDQKYSVFSDPTKGLSSVTTTVDGSVLKCSFNRIINSTDPDVVSLQRPWRLLYASGRVSGDRPIKHNLVKVSSGDVDFLSASRVTAAEPANTIVKIHGCLMIIAWMFFSSIGIVIARHYKAEWPNKTIRKQKVWFQLHRACMIMVFILTCTAFVLIFVELNGYQKVIVSDDRKYLEWHPILGIVVTSLTVINPIMSFFRCQPSDKRRPIFNIAHFTVGVSAHILSAITVIFGMNLDKSRVPAVGTYAMYAYVAVFVIIEIVHEVWRHSESKQGDKPLDPVELYNISGQNTESNKKEIHTSKKKQGRKLMLLCIHTITMLLCTALLAVSVLQNRDDDDD